MTGAARRPRGSKLGKSIGNTTIAPEACRAILPSFPEDTAMNKEQAQQLKAIKNPWAKLAVYRGILRRAGNAATVKQPVIKPRG